VLGFDFTSADIVCV